ncbi:class E sortase [Haematomicrobium sanguinis]|uniref:class E sortase n=1 Tax=Haematomicrobium sanguinis TaxID=479106 RepID=UPI00047EEAC4|nr:class E sortase [Haematomicrobium sanguinis]
MSTTVDELMGSEPSAERSRRSVRHGRTQKYRPRSPLQVVIQVIGELFITVGLILLLFVAWQLWWTNIEADATQAQAVNSLVKDFNPPPAATGEDPNKDYGEPVVGQEPPVGTQFGVMMIPRFGAEYNRPITTGVSLDVLNTLGVGHYPGTQMPGAVGNFAVAGHRQTYGQVFDQVHELRPGDKIYVWTKDGFYTYVFRNQEIVLPNRTDVLYPVPTQQGAEPTERILTLTTCNPRFGSTERIAAYAVMESWRPADAPAPAEIAPLVQKLSEKAQG